MADSSPGPSPFRHLNVGTLINGRRDLDAELAQLLEEEEQ